MPGNADSVARRSRNSNTLSFRRGSARRRGLLVTGASPASVRHAPGSSPPGSAGVRGRARRRPTGGVGRACGRRRDHLHRRPVGSGRECRRGVGVRGIARPARRAGQQAGRHDSGSRRKSPRTSGPRPRGQPGRRVFVQPGGPSAPAHEPAATSSTRIGGRGVGEAYSAAYTAAKHGVVGMTKALAVEYARPGADNCICPGGMDTPQAHTIDVPDGADWDSSCGSSARGLDGRRQRRGRSSRSSRRRRGRRARRRPYRRPRSPRGLVDCPAPLRRRDLARQRRCRARSGRRPRGWTPHRHARVAEIDVGVVVGGVRPAHRSVRPGRRPCRTNQCGRPSRPGRCRGPASTRRRRLL